MRDDEPGYKATGCESADYYYCQDCKGHNRCDEEITEEPEE